MKKAYILLLFTITLVLSACSGRSLLNIEDGISLYKVSNEMGCADALEVIYKDEEATYSLPCISSHWYEIQDSEGNTYTLFEALDEEVLSIDQMVELFDGVLYVEEVVPTLYDLIEQEYGWDQTHIERLGPLGEYYLYQYNNVDMCELDSYFLIKGQKFFSSSTCDDTFLSLGYIAEKNNELYLLEDLFEDSDLLLNRFINDYYPYYTNVDTPIDKTYKSYDSIDYFDIVGLTEDPYMVYMIDPTAELNDALLPFVLDYAENGDIKVYFYELREGSSWNGKLYVFNDYKQVQYKDGLVQVSEFLSHIKTNGLTEDDYFKELTDFRSLTYINGFHVTDFEGMLGDYYIFSGDHFSMDCPAVHQFRYEGFSFMEPSTCSGKFFGVGYYAYDPILHETVELMDLFDQGVFDMTDDFAELMGFKKEYRDVDYYDRSLEYITSNQELLSQEEDSYYVYFYSPNCSHCNNIKEDILTFFFDDFEEQVYLIDATNYQRISGYSNWGTYVPALIKIENGEIVEEYVGSIEVPNFIETYNNN